jgi:hypothetical protein
VLVKAKVSTVLTRRLSVHKERSLKPWRKSLLH